jgi:hypothetical protein
MNRARRRQSDSSAHRVREFRASKKRRAMLVTVEMPCDLPDALVENGFLAEWDAENLAGRKQRVALHQSEGWPNGS